MALYLGTSSWSSADWVGRVYPPGTPSNEFIIHYARQFSAVEIDSSFYHTPSARTVQEWARKTPETFVFAAKFPQVITHEKVLEDCAPELDEFLKNMSLLGSRLGPLLLQFPYYSKSSGMSEAEWLGRLERFLPRLPQQGQFAVEVRNKSWLKAPLYDLLRKHGVALALIDHPWMPRPRAYGEEVEIAPFSYLRWLGDRKGIEKITTRWNETIIDRTNDLIEWVFPVRRLLGRGSVYGFFNNHYAGHAPASLRLFEKLMADLPAVDHQGAAVHE